MTTGRVIRDDGTMKAIIGRPPSPEQERANASAEKFAETLAKLRKMQADGREVS